MTHVAVAILGSGPAGYTAAIYSARAMLAPTLFAGLQPGGQLTLTSEVENWPGEDEGILGNDLMANLRKQAERFGTTVVEDTVVSVEFSDGVTPHLLKTAGGAEFAADAVIVATGASAKWLGIPGEERLGGKGVSACATCDGFFFRGKEVVVIGGGDAAMEEAQFLTRFATKVTVIHRSEEFRASKIMLERARKHDKIVFVLNTIVEEILGEERVTGVRLKDTKENNVRDLATDGVFVAIGHQPNTKMFEGKLDLDVKGYVIVAPHSTITNVPGVFACGDVADHLYRQAVTAAGTGCMAAMDAERYLAKR